MPNRVREVRRAYLLTQSELAEKTGLSLRTIQYVERGTPCRFSTQRKLVTFFGLPFRDRRKIFP
jgi:DNA-binding XRE family transcriptional regulator